MAESPDLFHFLERGETDALFAALDEAGAAADKDASSSVNARDRWGCSLLYYAAGKGDPVLVEGLLERGAEVERASDAGNTPLMIAAARGHLKIVKRLLTAGADVAHSNRWGFDAHKWADWCPNATEVQAELFAARS
ncbi:ankyrin repeat domain-containing protein [Algihabitans albus]|uniref:ankyrin repeat domain-containing protein n=1 Tax=Algihabitans albus TaxID=2164067 RepID=UPI0013C33181|nr:ankyrin repeat domain-containing protein [Algihabitans albus]